MARLVNRGVETGGAGGTAPPHFHKKCVSLLLPELIPDFSGQPLLHVIEISLFSKYRFRHLVSSPKKKTVSRNSSLQNLNTAFTQGIVFTITTRQAVNSAK